MKAPLTLLLLCMAMHQSFSQADKSEFFYTRDKKLIGNKAELIKDCSREVDEEGMTEAQKNEVCDCVLQQMANNLTYKEFNRMVEDEDFDFEKIFEDKKHKEMANGVLQCVFSMMKNGSGPSSFRQEFLSECIRGFEEEAGAIPGNIDATAYCNCMLDKIIENPDIAGNFMGQADDEDSPLIAEAAVPCLMEAMQGNDEIADADTTAVPADTVSLVEPATSEAKIVVVEKEHFAEEKTPDVEGDILSVEVPLTRYLNTYTLKVKIGSVDGRFILDSGASDVLINKEFEKQLLTAGALSKADAVGERVYSLADGSKVKGKVYVLNNLQVGGFTVDNVAAGVISSDASLLLGKSFLDKFSEWRIDNERKTLYLAK